MTADAVRLFPICAPHTGDVYYRETDTLRSISKPLQSSQAASNRVAANVRENGLKTIKYGQLDT